MHFSLEIDHDNRINCVYSRKRYIHGGVQYHFKFANGWGASVVKHSFSYGSDLDLWELAVLDKTGAISYDNEITDDVVGYLTNKEVNDYLTKIRKL